MRSWKPRASIQTRLAAELTTPAAAADSPPDLPDNVVNWLVQATLMYGVPFVYMVPDARLLPPESLRFFYVDRNWLDRLVDGALSIGTNSSKDNVFNEQFFEAVYSEIDQGQAQFRADLRNQTVGAGTPAGGPLSGLLFRSVIVSTWPGLEVQATRSKTPVPILRMDRLSSDVLLVLFNGVPDEVDIIEPSEGLHMGIVDTQPAGTVEVVMRGLGTGGFDAGKPIPSGQGFLKAATTYRTGSDQPAGVLNIGTLVTNMQTALRSVGALGQSTAITAGGFAIEMVLGAGLQAFPATLPHGAPLADSSADR